MDRITKKTIVTIQVVLNEIVDKTILSDEVAVHLDEGDYTIENVEYLKGD